VFRRRTPPGPATEPAPASSGATAVGKGRPTPKRKVAEQARKQRLTPPKDRREAAAQRRQRMAKERALTRQALITGDDRHLPSRDRGPVRAFCRDFVDARRSAGEFLLPLLLVVFVLNIIVPQLAGYSSLIFFGTLLSVVMDTAYLIWKLRKELATRFPNEPTKGAKLYAVLRSSQLRRLRLPKPRVKVGASI
jgi:hypothetical protein